MYVYVVECSIHLISYNRYHHTNSRAVDKQAGQLLRQYLQISYMIWKCHVSVHNTVIVIRIKKKEEKK